jgi:ATP-dependent Clp protease ATP-binding subunit ClpC
MTSNIGVSNIDEIEKTIGFGDVAKVNEKNKKAAIDKALKKKFKPEFLNRLDSVVFFKDLDKNDYMKIIDIELNKLTENLKNNDTEYKDIKISFDKKVKNFIFNNGVDDKYGARPIKRAIEKEISSRVATVLLDHDCDENTEILVTIKRNNVHVEITQKESELISPKSKYLNGNG